MNPLCVLLIATILSFSSLSFAQVAPPGDAGAARESSTPRRMGEPAPLVFWNRPITVFRAYNDEVSPAERAAKAAARLADLPAEVTEWNVVANETSVGQYSGAIVTVNGQLAFGIMTEDLDRESGETLGAAMDKATAQLRSALEARSQQRRFPSLVRAIGLSILTASLLALGLWFVTRTGRRILAGMQAHIERLEKTRALAAGRAALGGFDLRPVAYSISCGATKLAIWVATAAMIYAGLTFVLLRFPYSQPWGQQLGAYLVNLFRMLGAGLVRAIPGIFTVFVIFQLTRLVARVVDSIFRKAEKGELALSWIDSDTARATRQLVVVLIWIFALTVAYPYIPGSSSDAFKGISVFVGLMASLGSAGFVNQLMSGIVVIYSRALRPGEFVRVGDDTGTVMDVGMLSTRILTRRHEEITVPNAVLVATKTINYSRHASDDGLTVGTTVTIGYDAPWRQVHAMLLSAAERTAGVRKDPAPRVWQKALSDFYVEYELLFNLDHPEDRLPILSELHMHIQDAFNEQGVQIMSPHFEGQPNEKVVVPKSLWFPKPVAIATGQPGADREAGKFERGNSR